MSLRKYQKFALTGAGFAALAAVAWIYWAESQPEAERELRVRVKAHLEAMFPEAMTPPPGVFGWRYHQSPNDARLSVVLVHGLDEPGDIWEDVVAAFAEQPVEVIELRYPNDQAIDASADFLAEEWADLSSEREVIFIAHSMGGLVVRDFVTRHYAPNGERLLQTGPSVRAAWLVATPNHGSKWARLRVWLELRDHFTSSVDQEYALFSALRDGTGAAKVDLRPGSAFLRELNERDWPDAIDLKLIAGAYLDREQVNEGLEALVERAPDEDLAASFASWGADIQEATGDGVVTVESVALEGFPPPIVLTASHRGLIRTSPIETGTPPALPILLDWLQAELD
jgi:pimeloyl-ACP methyl ester carboxylesterase